MRIILKELEENISDIRKATHFQIIFETEDSQIEEQVNLTPIKILNT